MSSSTKSARRVKSSRSNAKLPPPPVVPNYPMTVHNAMLGAGVNKEEYRQIVESYEAAAFGAAFGGYKGDAVTAFGTAAALATASAILEAKAEAVRAAKQAQRDQIAREIAQDWDALMSFDREFPTPVFSEQQAPRSLGRTEFELQEFDEIQSVDWNAA